MLCWIEVLYCETLMSVVKDTQWILLVVFYKIDKLYFLPV